MWKTIAVEGIRIYANYFYDSHMMDESAGDARTAISSSFAFNGVSGFVPLLSHLRQCLTQFTVNSYLPTTFVLCVSV